MVTATSQLTAYIIWACLALAVLLVVAQVIVSIGALAKAKAPEKSPTDGSAAGSSGIAPLDFSTLSADTVPAAVAEANKQQGIAEADAAKTTAALDLLGKLSSNIPLAVGGILLILIALVANGALGAELVLGPGGTPSGG